MKCSAVQRNATQCRGRREPSPAAASSSFAATPRTTALTSGWGAQVEVGDLGLNEAEDALNDSRKLSNELKQLFKDLPNVGLGDNPSLEKSVTEELLLTLYSHGAGPLTAPGLGGLPSPGPLGGPLPVPPGPSGRALPSPRGLSSLARPPLAAAPAAAGKAKPPAAAGKRGRGKAAAEPKGKAKKKAKKGGAGRGGPAAAAAEDATLNHAHSVLANLEAPVDMAVPQPPSLGSSYQKKELEQMLERLRQQRAGNGAAATPGRKMTRSTTQELRTKALQLGAGGDAKLVAEPAEVPKLTRNKTIGRHVMTAIERSRKVEKDPATDKRDVRKRKLEQSREKRMVRSQLKNGNKMENVNQEVESLLQRSHSLERNNRSLKMRLNFMNRLNSEQTIKIEKLEKERKELQAQIAMLRGN